MTDDLVAWLTAQLDDDERVAREATPGPWFTDLGADVIVAQSEEAGGHMVAEIPDCPDHQGMRPRDAAHIARHDPARVLREVQAKRAIMAHHLPRLGVEEVIAGEVVCNGETNGQDEYYHVFWPCQTIRVLAAVYADRPGYQERWRPE